MSQPDASLTPVGDRLRSVFGGERGRGTTHSAGCASWHAWCAYTAGASEALRQFAGDCEFEAGIVENMGEKPWPSMLGMQVRDPAEHAQGLRRAARLALQRAEGRAETQQAPGLAAASIAPQRAVQAGDNSGSEEAERG